MIPNIDYGLCTGCGGCADAYPQFFSIRDGKAWLTNEERFDRGEHGGIMTVCPFYAISLVDAAPAP